MKLQLMPGTTAAHVALGESRHMVIDALHRVGYPRVDVETPTRILRAYFGPRWDGCYINMTQEMVEEATAFLERLNHELWQRIFPVKAGSG